MIERVHEHIVAELQQNARTDTVIYYSCYSSKFAGSRRKFGSGFWPGQRCHNVDCVLHVCLSCYCGQFCCRNRVNKGQTDKNEVIKRAVEDVQRPGS